ncbi:MAG: hypothetical protein J1G38_00975 [Clostridiales bacterium]|nr:hypothetical protein [Clostridiales bacterium]
MKKLHKILVAVFMAALVAVIALFAVGCGETTTAKSAKLTGVYNSDKKIVYQNFQPTYNYYYFIISQQMIETYDDGTYCLTVTAVMYSNVKFGPDVPANEYTANEQGTLNVKYYGKCKETDKTADDTTLVLSKPTRIVSSKKGSTYIDTDRWTAAMADTTRPTDPSTGEKGDALTKAEYLEAQLKAWEEGDLEIYTILTTATFEAVSALIVSYM